jgi:hypothetical protein
LPYTEQYGPQPGTPEETPGGGGRGRRPLIVAAVVVLAAALGVGAVYAFSNSGSASSGGHPAAAGSTAGAPAPSGTAPAASGAGSAPASASASASGGGAAQASALNGLLDESMSSHQQVVDAVAAAQQCTSAASVTSAAAQLDSAAQARRQLVAKLDALDLSQVPGAPAAAAKLRQGWQHSAAADSAYAAWARAEANSCHANATPQNADYQTAVSDSGSATSDKKSFVLSWNQIAAQYGLPSRTWDGI